MLVAGGSDGFPLASAELYDSASGTWTVTGSLNIARDGHTATLLPNGKMLVAGGLDINGAPLTSAELYDSANGSWAFTGTEMSNEGRRYHTATLLRSGKVLVAGGADGVLVVKTADVYDPDTRIWRSTGKLNSARSSHTATLLSDGKVLVAGGSPAN